MRAPQRAKKTVRLFQASKKSACLILVAVLCISAIPNRLLADDKETTTKETPGKEAAKEAPQDAPPQTAEAAPKSLWKYNGFLDFGYLLDFNHPANHLFRERSTTFKVDELDLNMAEAGVKKETSEQSRWGMEFGVQGGKDSENFGFSATAPNVGGADWLRHFALANVSYLAPVGSGLTVQAGLFNSLIGYDALYAKDNFNYTRPWGADYTPYLMFGVNASYPFTKKITATGFVINDYVHLAHPNNVPSFGGQLSYSATGHLNFKETVLYGPHQSDTLLEFWRFFSDSIAEWKDPRLTTAFEYQIGTERVNVPGTPRALWMSAQLPMHRVIARAWSVTLRPEFAWDRDGRWTGSKQTIKAFTTTLEYRLPYWKTNTIARLEYRVDDSRGAGGGFFRGAEISPGMTALVPTQQMLVFGLIFTFESR
jgi:putative OmpL-like beta-barrel porin-2